MPIRIIRNGEVLKSVNLEQAEQPEREPTNQEILAKWQDFPPFNAKPTPCCHCGRNLIGHCGAGFMTCPNFVKRQHTKP